MEQKVVHDYLDLWMHAVYFACVLDPYYDICPNLRG